MNKTALALVALLLVASHANGQTIPQAGWTLQSVDSQDTNPNNVATKAFDGRPDTFWITQRTPATPPPHEIQINLGAVYTLTGFRVLARQDGRTNGRIAQYEFWVSTDGSSWGAVAVAGTLANVATSQQVTFPAKVGRFIRLRALTEATGQPWTAVAELNVLGSLAVTTSTLQGPSGPAGPAGPPGPQGQAGAAAVSAQQADGPCFSDTNTDRLIDCGNGTVTDTWTGLVWLQMANGCLPATPDENGSRITTWLPAQREATSLHAGMCGLTDGSSRGDWRIPSLDEFLTLLKPTCGGPFNPNGWHGPSLPNAAGDGCHNDGSATAFLNVGAGNYYWTRTTYPYDPYDPDGGSPRDYAYGVNVYGSSTSGGYASGNHKKDDRLLAVWAVRGGSR